MIKRNVCVQFVQHFFVVHSETCINRNLKSLFITQTYRECIILEEINELSSRKDVKNEFKQKNIC